MNTVNVTIGLLLFVFSFILLSAYKRIMNANNEDIFGKRVIKHMTYSKYGEEKNPLHFFRPDNDTIEVYQKNENTLYRFNVFFTSKDDKTTLMHRYIFFEKNSKNCLYYDEMNKENGYLTLNKDSVLRSNYTYPVGNPTDTGVFFTGLRNSTRTYNSDGVLEKEITVSPSLCNGRKDTFTCYYATKRVPVTIQLAPYLDSVRKQTLIKYEGIVCMPDTINNIFYRIRAFGELQTIGVVKSDHYIFNIFTEMEKRYSEMKIKLF
jgi:hypothetical protein